LAATGGFRAVVPAVWSASTRRSAAACELDADVAKHDIGERRLGPALYRTRRAVDTCGSDAADRDAVNFGSRERFADFVDFFRLYDRDDQFHLRVSTSSG
jgi:hypothetical protein